MSTKIQIQKVKVTQRQPGSAGNHNSKPGPHIHRFLDSITADFLHGRKRVRFPNVPESSLSPSIGRMGVVFRSFCGEAGVNFPKGSQEAYLCAGGKRRRGILNPEKPGDRGRQKHEERRKESRKIPKILVSRKYFILSGLSPIKIGVFPIDLKWLICLKNFLIYLKK